VVEHHGLAVLQIRRQRAEWCGKLIVVGDVGHAERRAAQRLGDLLPLHQTERKLDPLAISEPQ
jgi:hypothetical protein